jgi:hypothetical protein
MSSSEKLSPSGLSRGELEALIEHLLAENVALKQMVAGLRAEVAQLKGVKGKPMVKPAAKPSGMEQATKPPTSSRRQRERANKISPRVAREDRIVPAAVPQGSRLKGYEDFHVQELELRARLIRFRRERWQTPDGRTVTAPLPARISSHIGPQLQRFVLFQYHWGWTTVFAVLSRECLLPVSFPPPSSTGRTFSSSGSASEISRNCAVQRADLLTGRSPNSAAGVLYPAIFSGPVDWVWSVPFWKGEADQ